MNNIFITGGSGFIGRYVIAELLQAGHKLYVLVRSEEKLYHALKEIGCEDFSSIVAVRGDLTLPSLGLSDDELRKLQDVDVIVHAGGPMDILMKAREARQVFLGAARELSRLAGQMHAAKGIKQFIHVVGFKSPYGESGVGGSVPIDHKAPPYEQMKFEADLLLRQAMQEQGIPLSVVNPSAVIGDSRNGITSQTGGFGLLIRAVSRNLMGLVPGGDRYWLPLVHVDHVAVFIAALVEEVSPANGTYFLLDDRKDSPSMMELIRIIAREMRVAAPKGSAPYPLVKSLLKLGADKLLGLPVESMDFIVNTEFPTATKQAIEAKHHLQLSLSADTLPLVIADLDFRLNHSDGPAPLSPPFRRNARAGLATIESKGSGAPIVVLHGTFSASDSLLPLAERLAESGRPVYLVDLPGFGRSPYHRHSGRMQGFEQAVLNLIASFDEPVALVGHSFGGLLASRMLELAPERIAHAVLLQPVLEPVSRSYRRPRVTQAFLRRMSEQVFVEKLLQSRSFRSAEEIPEGYISFVRSEMKSPRTRKTTAEIMSLLSRSESWRFAPNSWNRSKVSIVWGTQDQQTDVPPAFSQLAVTRLPYAHQFPLSHPDAAAAQILERIGI